MKRLFFLLFALLCNSAMADQFYVIADYDCNQDKGELVIRFRGLWNEEGEKALANLGNSSWDPRKLISFERSKDGRYSVTKKEVSRVCGIGGNKFDVVISPMLAPGFDPEGWCATRVGVQTTISQNGSVIANDGVDACTERGMVTKGIVIKPGQAPYSERENAESFYKE